MFFRAQPFVLILDLNPFNFALCVLTYSVCVVWSESNCNVSVCDVCYEIKKLGKLKLITLCLLFSFYHTQTPRLLCGCTITCRLVDVLK